MNFRLGFENKLELKAKGDAATVTEHAGIGEEEEEDEGEEEDEREALGVQLSAMMGWKINTSRDRERCLGHGGLEEGTNELHARSLRFGRAQNHRDNGAHCRSSGFIEAPDYQQRRN